MKNELTQHIALALIFVLLPISVSIGFEHYHPEQFPVSTESTYQEDHGHDAYQPPALCQVCHFFSGMTIGHVLHFDQQLVSTAFILPSPNPIPVSSKYFRSFGRAPPHQERA